MVIVVSRQLTNLLTACVRMMTGDLHSYSKYYSFDLLDGRFPHRLTCLDVAAMRGQAEIVQIVTNSDMFARPYSINTHGSVTPLMLAARFGQARAVQSLLPSRVSTRARSAPIWGINEQCFNGFTAIHYAVFYGHEDIVEMLLDEGADANISTGGYLKYSLAFAAALNRNNIVRCILSRGEPPSNTMRLALHAAAASGNNEAVTELLSHAIHGNVTARSASHVVDWSVTLSEVCDVNGCILVAVDGLSSEAEAGRAESQMECLDIDAVDDEGNTALLVAASAGHTNTTQMLIDREADVYRVNKAGKGLWHFILKHDGMALLDFMMKGVKPEIGGNRVIHVAASENMHDAVARLLAKYPGMSEERNADGNTALYLAAAAGHVESVAKLLEYPESMCVTNGQGRTALHAAAIGGHTDAVIAIGDAMVNTGRGALLDARCDCGRTALHYAVIGNHAGCIASLARADPSIKDKFSCNPIHLAALSCHSTALLKTILEIFYKPAAHNKDIDELCVDRHGEMSTALMIVTEAGSTISVRLLLMYGACVDATDANGMTVLHRLVRRSAQDAAAVPHMIHVFDIILEHCRNLLKQASPMWPGLWHCYKTLILKSMQQTQHCRNLTVGFKVGSEQGSSFGNMMTRLTFEMEAKCGEDKAYWGMTPIQFAAATGAVDMLEAMIGSTEDGHTGVLRLRGIIPRAFYDKQADEGRSCMELIATHCNPHQVAEMFRIEPLNEFVRRFTILRTWAFYAIFAFHIAYMSSFTNALWNTCIQGIDVMQNITSTSVGFEVDHSYVAYLIWPTCIILFELLSLIKYMLKRKFNKEKLQFRKITLLDDINLEKYITLFKHSVHASSCIVFVCSWTWYVWYNMLGTGNFAHYTGFVAVLVLLGWVYAAEYMHGFKSTHALGLIIKIVIANSDPVYRTVTLPSAAAAASLP